MLVQLDGSVFHAGTEQPDLWIVSRPRRRIGFGKDQRMKFQARCLPSQFRRRKTDIQRDQRGRAADRKTEDRRLQPPRKGGTDPRARADAGRPELSLNAFDELPELAKRHGLQRDQRQRRRVASLSSVPREDRADSGVDRAAHRSG